MRADRNGGSAISPRTELACLQGKENTSQRFPQHPGYSGVGRIVGVAPGGEGFKIGERVIMDHCGHQSHALCMITGWHGQGITKIENDAISSSEAAFMVLSGCA